MTVQGDQPWDFFGGNDAEAETPVVWPPHAKSWLTGKDWCWEGMGAGGEGGDRGWDGWMASLTRWTRVWVNSGSWWWTGRPGMLWFMGSQRVRHDWVTELNWTGKDVHYLLFARKNILYVNILVLGNKLKKTKEKKLFHKKYIKSWTRQSEEVQTVVVLSFST